MTKPCLVSYCKNIGRHRFPKDEVRKTKWIQAVKYVKPSLSISKFSMLCSAHFRASDFSKTPSWWNNYHTARRILKKTAIPSVFLWSKPSLEKPAPPIQDSLSFDPAKVQTTYSRIPPIAFAEEQLGVVSAAIDVSEDPLECIDHEPEQVLDKIEPEQVLDKIDSDNVVDELIVDCDPGMVYDVKEEILEVKILEEQLHESDQLNAKSVQTINVETDERLRGFSIYHYKDYNKSLNFYTGFENFEKIKLVFNSLGNATHKLNYFDGKPPTKIDALEQFFITLIILRRHQTFEEISMLYKIKKKLVYSIFVTWIRFMSKQWKKLDIWIDKERIAAHMPLEFLDEYPETRVMLDCVEFPIKKPNLPSAQQKTFSADKKRNTVKVLIGITPSGMISYVSPTYGGSTTDRQIIEKSTLLDKFDDNDEVMLYKDLNVQDIFKPYGVKVNRSAFLKNGGHIASAIHSRVISTLKSCKILIEPMNQTETLLSGDIVFVCAMLVNFRTNHYIK